MGFISDEPDDCFQLRSVQVVAFVAPLLGCPAHDVFEPFVIASWDFFFKSEKFCFFVECFK